MNHTEFVISRFENRNGTTSWRVSGWLHGLRIRKNLKSKEEAAAAPKQKVKVDSEHCRPRRASVPRPRF